MQGQDVRGRSRAVDECACVRRWRDWPSITKRIRSRISFEGVRRPAAKLMFLIPVSRSGVLLLSAQRFRKVRLRDADWLAMTASTFVGPEHQASRSTMNDPSDGLGDR